MTSGLLVSIIVPVFNEKNYLRDCLDSILNQTYKTIEVIIVDDGSDSETANICDYYASIDNRVKVIHKQNEGLSSARITGLNNSKGSWICFSDHDDIIGSTALESLVEFAADGVDIVSGKRLDFTGDLTIEPSGPSRKESFVLSGDDAIEKIPTDNQKTIITPLWGKLYRRGLLERINLVEFKELCPIVFFEDVLMTPILFHHSKKIVFIDEVVYYHREIPTSISRSGIISNFYIDQVNSGIVLLEFVKKHGLLKYYNHEINVYIKSIIRIWCLISLKDKKREHVVKKQIRINFKKYYKAYLRNNGLPKKVFAIMFFAFPHIVKVFVILFIHKKRRKALSNPN